MLPVSSKTLLVVVALELRMNLTRLSAKMRSDNHILLKCEQGLSAKIYPLLFPASKIAKKLPKNEPQGGPSAGGRARGGVDLQEATPQGRSGQCCGGGN